MAGDNRLTWRELREADVAACMAVQPLALGEAVVGRDKAIEVWRALLRNAGFVARVIEAEAPRGRRTMGLGASVFVAPAFLEAEISNPRPGLNSRIIASLSNGHSVLLSEDQIARSNAGSGLDVVFLSFVWWSTATPLAFSEMLMSCVGSCVEAHAGYRLRSALVECPGEIMRAIGRHSGDFEIIREFTDVDLVWMRMTRERASTVAASASNLLFQYREPILGLGASDQRLLLAALGGAVDRELAVELGLTLPAVKKRWRSIFEKVQDRMPELFADVIPEAAGTMDEQKRGPQKRHLVLSYVRQHLEELRPYRNA
jgi:hypothetical protein